MSMVLNHPGTVWVLALRDLSIPDSTHVSFLKLSSPTSKPQTPTLNPKPYTPS